MTTGRRPEAVTIKREEIHIWEIIKITWRLQPYLFYVELNLFLAYKDDGIL